MNEIRLLEGETVLWEGKPLENLIKYYRINGTLFLLFMGLMFLGLFGLGIILMLLSYPIAIALADKQYEKRYYMITNKRIIYKRGFLGYKISSIPIERISDVVLTRGYLENKCNFSSLQIQTLAGQISQGSAGSEGDLKAIPEPEKNQDLILNLLKKSTHN